MGEATNLYDHDYYAWALDQAQKLRAWPEHLRPNGIDTENLAEEIEGLSRSEERVLGSLLENLFLHLLKLEWHPQQENRRHWTKQIDNFRRDVLRYGDRKSRYWMPKLWSERAEIANEALRYASAKLLDELRADQLEIPGSYQPAYELETQVLHVGWCPEYRGGAIPSPAPRRRKRAG